MNVAERLDRLETRIALSDLVARYSAAVDANDPTAITALFTEDAAFNDLTGRRAVLEFFEQWRVGHGASFHTPHAQVFDIESADDASGQVTAHAEGRHGDDVWVMGVRYSDRYRREGGAWLISARNVSYIYRLKAEEYLTRFGDVIGLAHGKEET